MLSFLLLQMKLAMAFLQWVFTYNSLITSFKALISQKRVTVKKGLHGVNTAIGNTKKDAHVVCYCTIWGISLQALAFFLARESHGGSAGLHGVIGRLEECLPSFSTAEITDVSWAIGPAFPANNKISITHQRDRELKTQFLPIIFPPL